MEGKFIEIVVEYCSLFLVNDSLIQRVVKAYFIHILQKHITMYIES